MNSHIARSGLTAVLALALLGVTTARADTSINAAADTQEETVAMAEQAHREAVDDAVVRISAATRLELDVDLPARVSASVSGD